MSTLRLVTGRRRGERSGGIKHFWKMNRHFVFLSSELFTPQHPVFIFIRASSTSNVTFFSITRNFVVSPVSRHFLYSVTSPRDFGVSPVSRTLFDMT